MMTGKKKKSCCWWLLVAVVVVNCRGFVGPRLLGHACLVALTPSLLRPNLDKKKKKPEIPPVPTLKHRLTHTNKHARYSALGVRIFEQ